LAAVGEVNDQAPSVPKFGRTTQLTAQQICRRPLDLLVAVRQYDTLLPAALILENSFLGK
jgi:hypothetical protein